MYRCAGEYCHAGRLFAKWPDAESLAKAKQGEVEKMIQSTGFFRSKATSIRESAADIVSEARRKGAGDDG